VALVVAQACGIARARPRGLGEKLRPGQHRSPLEDRQSRQTGPHTAALNCETENQSSFSREPARAQWKGMICVQRLRVQKEDNTKKACLLITQKRHANSVAANIEGKHRQICCGMQLPRTGTSSARGIPPPHQSHRPSERRWPKAFPRNRRLLGSTARSRPVKPFRAIQTPPQLRYIKERVTAARMVTACPISVSSKDPSIKWLVPPWLKEDAIRVKVSRHV